MNERSLLKLGQQLKDEGENNEPVSEILFKESSTPLFIKDRQGGNEGNARDAETSRSADEKSESDHVPAGVLIRRSFDLSTQNSKRRDG